MLSGLPRFRRKTRGKKLRPSVRLCDLLQNCIAALEKARHVALQKELFYDKADERHGRCEEQHISHPGTTPGQSLKEVVMLQRLEGACDHGVLKVTGRGEGRDFAREGLTHAEVFGAPAHILIWADQSGGHPFHRLFACVLRAE